MSDDFFNDQQLLAPAGVCRSGEILRAKTMVQWYHMVMVPIWYGITSFLILYSNKCEDFGTSIKSAIITCFRRFDDIYHPSQCWKTNTGYPLNISRQIPYYPEVNFLNSENIFLNSNNSASCGQSRCLIPFFFRCPCIQLCHSRRKMDINIVQRFSYKFKCPPVKIRMP